MMGIERLSDAGVARVSELIRKSAQSIFCYYVGSKNCTEESVDGDLSVYGHWMSLILVVGEAIRITFKAHFMEEDARRFVAQVTGVPFDDVKGAQAIDYIKEYCNLVAGILKKGLLSQGAACGISLPMVTRGFDEVFFPKADGVRAFSACWKFKSEHGEIVCSTLFEVQEASKLENLNFDEVSTKHEDNGDIEFL